MTETGKCALCMLKDRFCQNESGTSPAFCSTKLYPEAVEKANEEYKKPEIREFARQASIQEAECYINRDAKPHYLYPTKPRLQEIIEFSRKMGYKKLGLAFCTGVHREAKIFAEILEAHGFEIVSVMCKVGKVEKEFIGIEQHQKVRPGEYETMCNPIAQAEVLNAAGTDFNIIMGLCVGHDSLFIKYSKAMVTVFAVKDRLLGHNPMAAIYTAKTYYQRFDRNRLDGKK